VYVCNVPTIRVARWFVFKPIWVNFGRPYVDWKILIHFMAIWNILWRFGIFYDHLVHFVFIWYIFYSFGIMYQEKSGNPTNNTYVCTCKYYLKQSLILLLHKFFALMTFSCLSTHLSWPFVLCLGPMLWF
jgi:hypothetical protein